MAQEAAVNITEQEFTQLAAFLKGNYGINLSSEKKTLVVGRLGLLLAQHNFQSFSEYFNYVLSDTTGNAMVTLLDKITTNHTFFMREPEHFEYLRNIVLPYFDKHNRARDLRIWSAGCSTGEEPYTLAMIIDEYFGEKRFGWNIGILATDISTNALNKAKRAEYTEEQIEAVPRQWKLSYFRKISNNNYVLVDKIKKDVLYRRLNLMEDNFPFKKKFHCIFCRNVMIYFDTETKQKLVEKYYNNIEQGGYLFIGHSETLNNLRTKFKYVMPAVYRKE
jgi:chemotaxis protein methyltransferase CheR